MHEVGPVDQQEAAEGEADQGEATGREVTETSSKSRETSPKSLHSSTLGLTILVDGPSAKFGLVGIAYAATDAAYPVNPGWLDVAGRVLGIRAFGFAPLRLPADLDFTALFHGVDERVPVDALEFGARVFDRFLGKL